ncbi:hypothetical protein E0H47_27535 [Rhizobium leguminosarum bv. viciae]|uniref:nitroreductase family protein n=1 Tax=Rhizobium leguminosarum TaxID=384 RepID=UPI00103D60DC|nr:nitroreductase family protein [Rhizobium leguminosarum]TBZ33422.1 hypothetical protein E0H47_27535 [Rhizobium leguminosarum bv. viciae]
MLDIPRLVPPSRNFVDLLRSRRSARQLEIATLSEVAAVVREALKADFIGTGPQEGRKRKRVISAGALHPVKCVVVDPDAHAVAYDDKKDEFLSIEPRNSVLLADGLAKSAAILPTANGHIISLIADVRALSIIYANPDSLLWRDAGAVLQTLALVCEAFDLGFCPLGILGQELADALLPADHQFLGVGIAVIGRRVAR